MRRSRDTEFGLSLPFRATPQRVTLLVLIFAATALFMIGKNNRSVAETARITLADIMVPVLDVLSQPIVAMNWLSGEIVNVIFVYQENAILRDDNRRLLQWQALAQKLEQENARFSAMLNVRNERPTAFLTPRVVADSSGPFVRTRLLNVGDNDGVRKGNVAMDDYGVVGQVVAVGRRSARLLLLTDLNSRVPVSVGAREFPAILAGDNTRLPTIMFLPVGAQVRPGDRVVTSGAGGIFPPRMPVGRVVSVNGDVVRVQLFADVNRLDFVHLLDYRIPLRLEGQEGGSASENKP